MVLCSAIPIHHTCMTLIPGGVSSSFMLFPVWCCMRLEQGLFLPTTASDDQCLSDLSQRLSPSLVLPQEVQIYDPQICLNLSCMGALWLYDWVPSCADFSSPQPIQFHPSPFRPSPVSPSPIQPVLVNTRLAG